MKTPIDCAIIRRDHLSSLCCVFHDVGAQRDASIKRNADYFGGPAIHFRPITSTSETQVNLRRLFYDRRARAFDNVAPFFIFMLLSGAAAKNGSVRGITLVCPHFGQIEAFRTKTAAFVAIGFPPKANSCMAEKTLKWAQIRGYAYPTLSRLFGSKSVARQQNSSSVRPLSVFSKSVLSPRLSETSQ
jgi:hypothetical protein